MAAWKHYANWADDYYKEYRSFVAKMAPTLWGRNKNSNGEDLDCADLSIGLLIDFASSKGLPLNFMDASGFLYASKAVFPFGANNAARPSEAFLTKDIFMFIVRKYIQTKSLYLYNTEGSASGPGVGDLMIRYNTTIMGTTDQHHTALVFAVYNAGVHHDKETANVPSFPGPDEAMRQVRVTEYFMGTVDEDGETKYRTPDNAVHFDYLNSRGDAKRNAELIYFANEVQLSRKGFEFRQYAPFVLWGWPGWDGIGRPPLFDNVGGAGPLRMW